jgi:hypothetical protein
VLDVGDGIDLEIQGSVALDAFGVLIAKDASRVQTRHGDRQGRRSRSGGGIDTTYQAMALTLARRRAS